MPRIVICYLIRPDLTYDKAAIMAKAHCEFRIAPAVRRGFFPKPRMFAARSRFGEALDRGAGFFTLTKISMGRPPGNRPSAQVAVQRFGRENARVLLTSAGAAIA